MTVVQEAVAWRFFAVTVSAVRRLSPSFVRLTLTGPDLDEFADNGRDQRFKLVLPVPGRGFADLPTSSEWYAAWRQLPEELRNPVRTYTVRAVRPARREVDVDMVLHGSTGPASRFAETAQAGDELVLLGPNTRYPGDHGGVEFRPSSGDCPVLLAADETAVPAVASVLSGLPLDARGEVVLEVPAAEDFLDVTMPAGVRVTWLARGDDPHGSLLVPAVVEAARRLGFGSAGRAQPAGPDVVPEPSDGGEPFWEVPEGTAGSADCYAWLAGESSAITTLRRHLVRDLGVDRRSVAFMGYWRQGRPSP